MKKLLGIIVLGLLLSGNAYSMSSQQAIEEFFKNKKIDKVEGLWRTPANKFGPSDIVAIHKIGNSYIAINLNDGSVTAELNTSTSNRYNGICTMKNYKNDNRTVTHTFPNEDLRLMLISDNRISFNCDWSITIQGQSASGSFNESWSREWPSDINSYNAKFGNKPEKKIEMITMINEAKATCKLLGMKEETQQFSDCALKLYAQSIEIAAKEKQTIVQSKVKTNSGTSSSGSNVMTIYDPVRDNNALMNKGMKMLSGNCTLGVDC
ncbi:hypothetical protein N9R73_01895 [Candidatus Pelagibacter sp.]|nr:hypothetical protein [Candidatus Pelagibacter sp.]